jgi:integrase
MGTQRTTRERGQGSIINRPGTDKLYIRYYAASGKQVQEAVGSNDRKAAQDLLTLRMGERELGIKPAQEVKQIKYEDVRDSYVAAHPLDPSAKTKIGYLDGFFANMRVMSIDTDVLREFISDKRDNDLLADATIRRILGMLRSMFNQAKRENKIRHADVPYFPMPADSEPAGEYIAPDQFGKILEHLPEAVQPLFKFMYGTGCRLGAAQQITWNMVNDTCDVISLPGTIIKTKKPLLLVLDGPMLAPLAALLRKQFRRNDAPVFDSTNYRVAWSVAVAKAGLGTHDEETRVRTGVRIHDCRCSAAINLLDAGVDEGTVLKIGGWKTRAMLDRYNVQNEKRIRAAMQKGGAHVAARMNGTK